MPGPNDKKHSGSGHARPLDGSASAASSNNPDDLLRASDFLLDEEIRARDFWTRPPSGMPLRVRWPASAMSSSSTMSSSSSLSSVPRPGGLTSGNGVTNRDLKQQHFQVVPNIEGINEYTKINQKSDEKYRKEYAIHPKESLLSVHNGRNFSQGWFEYHDAGSFPVGRMPESMVLPGRQFSQRELGGIGGGICSTLALCFNLYRRLGLQYKEIFQLFRRHPKAFIKLQKTPYGREDYHFFSHVFATTAYLQTAEKCLLTGELPGLDLRPAPKPASKWPATPGGAMARSLAKHLVDSPPAHRAPPFGVHAVSQSLSFYAVVGHFELEWSRPKSHKHLMEYKGQTFCGDDIYEVRYPVSYTARGLTADWTIPRVDHEKKDNPAEKKGAAKNKKSSPHYRETALNPHIGAYLFSAMQRKRRQTVAGGKMLECFPYFYIRVEGDHDISHAIVVEFNTDAADENITTPRGIFDPNYGWIRLQHGFCSLDLDMVLHDLYLGFLQKKPYASVAPPGCLIAFQLQTITSGTTDDAATVAKWGGLPWMQVPSR